jgi:hypothetical protein
MERASAGTPVRRVNRRIQRLVLRDALAIAGLLWVVGAVAFGWHDTTGRALILLGATAQGLGGLLGLGLLVVSRSRDADENPTAGDDESRTPWYRGENA